MNDQPAPHATSAANGSRQDPAEILGKHVGWLRTVIRARLLEPGDVEDVLQ